MKTPGDMLGLAATPDGRLWGIMGRIRGSGRLSLWPAYRSPSLGHRWGSQRENPWRVLAGMVSPAHFLVAHQHGESGHWQERLFRWRLNDIEISSPFVWSHSGLLKDVEGVHCI